MQGKYIAVGENIHCTRVRLVKGKFVKELGDGRFALVFSHAGESAHLPIPADIVEGEEWANGKVRHVAVAVRQGMRGSDAERTAGAAYIQAMAREQEMHGAHFLDINVDEYSMEVALKVEAMRWVAETVQSVSSVPLSIDSPNAEILAAGLGVCDAGNGKPLVNSVSLERADLIGVAAAAGAKVVAGATGRDSMPAGVEDRMANLAELLGLLKDAGIALGDTYLDPLVFPISVDATNGAQVLETIAACRALYGPEVHFAPGLSNVSFGMPKRPLINQVFAHLCLLRGCDGGIVDPAQINDALFDKLDVESEPYRLASDLLLGADEYGMEFISASREGVI